MISSWVDDLPAFLRGHFQRAPFARPAAARRAIRLLTWDTVGRLVEAGADMLVVRNGQLVDHRPTTFAEALTMFREGHSLVLRRCEKHDPSLRALADSVESEFEGDVSIQVYATPRDFHSFGRLLLRELPAGGQPGAESPVRLVSRGSSDEGKPLLRLPSLDVSPQQLSVDEIEIKRRG